MWFACPSASLPGSVFRPTDFRLGVLRIDPVFVLGLPFLAVFVEPPHHLGAVGNHPRLGCGLLHIAPVILLGVAPLQLPNTCVGLDDGRVEAEAAPLEPAVFAESPQDDLQRGLVTSTSRRMRMTESDECSGVFSLRSKPRRRAGRSCRRRGLRWPARWGGSRKSRS